MFIHYNYSKTNISYPVVTLGVFDGVHRGHTKLLESVVTSANRTGGESVAITFDPHPRLVLSDNIGGFSYLSTLNEKEKLIGKTGINHLVVIPFNKEISSLSALDFIRQILVKELKTAHLVVGYDHHFGRGREGNYDLIVKWGKEFGFGVEQFEEVSTPGGIISSTSIREALLTGRLGEANNWLGYSYSVTGNVVKGREIGRKLGFPTANVNPDDPYKLIPSNGVYAVEVIYGSRVLKGMLNIGTNPTVNSDPSIRTIEVNIFDFDEGIYGKEITVLFRFRLRDEIMFETTDSLAEQMSLDRERALKLLS
jgi:riboflavin kinase/FMN adenylyltransferase